MRLHIVPLFFLVGLSFGITAHADQFPDREVCQAREAIGQFRGHAVNDNTGTGFNELSSEYVEFFRAMAKELEKYSSLMPEPQPGQVSCANWDFSTLYLDGLACTADFQNEATDTVKKVEGDQVIYKEVYRNTVTGLFGLNWRTKKIAIDEFQRNAIITRYIKPLMSTSPDRWDPCKQFLWN